MKVKPMNTDRYIPPFHGETPFLSLKEKTALADRIRLPVDIDTFNPNACWLAVPGRRLYTSFGWHGEITRTHRVSYQHFHCTAIPKGCVVNHICENAGCINPDHLETVSPSDNA